MSESGTERETTHVDPKRGLWIPPEFREFDQQVAIRSPKGTVQHFGSSPMEPYYGLIRERDFGPVEEIKDPRNEHLAPDRVSIKKQGEDAVELQVEFGTQEVPADE